MTDQLRQIIIEPVSVNNPDLFTGLGKLVGMWEVLEASEADIETQLAEILAAYQSQNAYVKQEWIDGLEQDVLNWHSTMRGWKRTLAAYCSNIVIQAVNDDQLQTDQSLKTALAALFAGMRDQGDSFNAPTPSSVFFGLGPVVGNEGNADLIGSVLDPYGDDAFWVIPETITTFCTQDGENSGIRGNETFEARAQSSTEDRYSYLWPTGSGGRLTLTATDPANVNENFVPNGDMEDFTNDTPDGWEIQVGAAGVDVFQELVEFYRGASSLKFEDATGAVLIKLRAPTIGLQTRSQYMIGFHIKSASLAGDIQMTVVDSAGVPIDANCSATSSAFTGGDWLLVYCVLTTPANLPDDVYVEVSLTTALAAASPLYIDDLFVSTMEQISPSKQGPDLSVITGNVFTIYGDQYNAVVNNLLDGLWIKFLWRLFGSTLLQMPQPPVNDAGAETITDSLIS